jgi:hypothetical protein
LALFNLFSVKQAPIESVTCAVGQFAGMGLPCISATIAPTNLSLRLRCVPSGFTASSEQPVVSFQSLAFAVGHDEHPLSLVRSADFSRAEYSPRRSVTHASQLIDDFP